MKKKNLFVLISFAVFLLIALLIWWLLGRNSKLNEEHIALNFEIHNCTAPEKNKELLKSDFLQPLLEHFVVKESSGLENLFLTRVTCNDISFSIPAIGINSFRYNYNAPTLKESTMTSTSRLSDEEAFFSSWDAEDYSNLENILLKANPNQKENNDLAYLTEIINSESDELIPDSIIIDKNCQSEQPPFLFSSTSNARKFINKKLEKNGNALVEQGKSGDIHLFIWCGDGYITNPDDLDNDGVLNESDLCPDAFGEVSNKGCPIIKDRDGDGVPDDIDQCVDKPGSKDCGGCICPTPPPLPDKDKDGIPDVNDKCPDEYGLKKYKGCPIPDTDKDGINDEIDKCPTEKGPQSNNGCPLRIRVTHNNSDGTFTVNGVSNINDYNVVMYIKESNGRVIEHKFTGYVSPYPHEAKKLTKLIGDPVETTVKVVVSDKNNKELESFTFKGLSMICFSDGDCGFVDLNKN
jgi:hypothetical protein